MQVKYLFKQELVHQKRSFIQKIRTAVKRADLGTKYLDKTVHLKHAISCGLRGPEKEVAEIAGSNNRGEVSMISEGAVQCMRSLILILQLNPSNGKVDISQW